MGRIAPEIGALSSLRELTLRDNNLQGLVPRALNTLSQLTEFDVEGNRLVGNPFSALTGATNLRRLRLSSNQFAGRLPNNLDNLDKLRELYISDNFFSGSIPSVIGNMEVLGKCTNYDPAKRYGHCGVDDSVSIAWSIDLTPHSFLCVLSESLLLYSNGFDGTIPSEIGNLRLFHLYAHSNKLSGPIPEEFWDNRDLIDLRLDNNELDGTLSQRIGNLGQLRDLRLANNSFTGNLPVLLFRLDGIGKLEPVCSVLEVLLLAFGVPLLPILFLFTVLNRESTPEW
jgi:Leucine-rich repeat (LRR) protein